MRITVTPIFSDGRLDGRLIGLADNAAARRLERRLYAGQKVESLGAMAGGLAHDFNNLLTGIFSSLSLALSEVPESAPVRSSLDAIRDAAAGMTALTDQLALFAGRRPPSVETFELSGLVREIEDLLRSAAGRRTRLTFELDRSPLIVRADASQVRHAIANLIANARENLQDGAGAIVLRTGSLSPERAFFEVSDSGEGLSDRDLEGVFEPFRGASGQQGSGIALPVVQSIARSHGGEAEVRSVPGKGTTFRVTLPKTEPAERAAKASARSVAAGPFRVGGAVLIVDDESVVRSGVAAMLESLGFETIEAKEGREGVDLFERNAERIVLVILDLTMPVMDGAEAFERIKAIRSTVPVVIMSGYAEREVSESFEGKRVAAFLHKPFGVDELGRAIRSMQP
jgi:nitrogen-specific signal transduction histidine kinase/CheY-like chemotaxis protein